jgi:hypothetical protein
MRALSAIAAGVLVGCAAAAPSQAANPAGPALSSTIACDEPGPGYHPAVRPHRHVVVRRHVRHHRRWWPAPVVMVPPPPPPLVFQYNAPIPSPWDSAYDRAMTVHYRSPAVTGVWGIEPGLPPTPPVWGTPYTYAAGAAALQYDAMAGNYVALAQADIHRVPPPPIPPPPVP